MGYTTVTFTYQDSAGNGIAAATIWLRGEADNFASDLYQLTDVSGIAGAYKARIQNMPRQNYKAWINGSKNDSFGGDDGIELGELSLKYALKSAYDVFVTAVNASITSLTSSVAGKVSKAGGSLETIITPLTFASQRPNRDDGIAAGSYATITDAVFKDDLDLAIATATGGLQYFTTVSVVPGKADNSGIQYNTVKKAVDFCLLTGMASATKRFRVVIENMPSGAAYINIEAGCFHNYIDIKGADQSIMVKPADANPTAIMRLENLTLFLSTAGGNRIFSGISTKEIDVQGFNNVTFKGGSHSSNDISVSSGKTVTFDKTSGGEYANVKRCLSKVDPTFTDGEDYDKARDCRFESGLSLIADPDLA